MKTGHSPPRILKSEDLPHPLGPVTIQFMPYLISKSILLTRLSPLGETIGTSLNLIVSSVSMIDYLLRETNYYLWS